jgi:hypothetical protein
VELFDFLNLSKGKALGATNKGEATGTAAATTGTVLTTGATTTGTALTGDTTGTPIALVKTGFTNKTAPLFRLIKAMIETIVNNNL